jgi:hypothetical protein
MTGTADTEAQEFHDIYASTSCRSRRTARWFAATMTTSVFLRAKGQVGGDRRRDQARSRRGPPDPGRHDERREVETLSPMLTSKYGIKHEVLNAKQHEREANIVAGRRSARRGHDRDQHGRPRHRHQARRRSPVNSSWSTGCAAGSRPDATIEVDGPTSSSASSVYRKMARPNSKQAKRGCRGDAVRGARAERLPACLVKPQFTRG